MVVLDVRREIEWAAADSALDLGDPRRALTHFAAARRASPGSDDEYTRDDAFYLACAAGAHLTLGEIDEACAAASHSRDLSGGVDSALLAGALTDLRHRLAPHRDVRAARDFLTAP